MGLHEQETKIKEIPCTAIANIDFKLFGIAYVCAMNSLFECVVVVAPVMHEANHRSAMYTQLLAGDLVERVEDLPSVWMAVKLQGDAMIGYVLKAHVRYPANNCSSALFIAGRTGLSYSALWFIPRAGYPLYFRRR
ncbi:MAG: hypothetical protein HWD58_00840 [Bacteroidota bacterium]|nr:MAG: hypothetical protein HWD58_00840 [Bacteroidota bacterium]